MTVRIVCLTSDKGNWCLPGFMHQWRKYARFLEIEVAGFTDPGGLDVPFISLGRFADYPADKYTNALRKYLESVTDSHVLIMLEDYWLTRQVSIETMSACLDFVDKYRPFRLDLTSDRMYSNGKKTDVISIGATDFFINGPSEYQLSLQASIWDREALSSFLVMDESPWDLELKGTRRLNADPSLIVASTRQWPIRYQIVVNKGCFEKDGDWMFPPRQLTASDYSELEKLGYTQK